MIKSALPNKQVCSGQLQGKTHKKKDHQLSPLSGTLSCSVHSLTSRGEEMDS